LIFSFTKDAGEQVDSIFKNTTGKVRIPEPKKAYLRLPKNYFEPKMLIGTLRKILTKEKNKKEV
jgi:hypothetical protein